MLGSFQRITRGYLRSNYEDERLIENELKFLIGGPDIKLTRPVTEATWTDYLFDGDSVLAEKAEKSYRTAIKGQVKACQRVFVRPLTVLSGAAGTRGASQGFRHCRCKACHRAAYAVRQESALHCISHDATNEDTRFVQRLEN